MNLKDLFIKKTDEPKKKVESTVVQTPVYTPPPVANGISNEDYNKHLEGSMRKAAHNKGIDYLEFSDAIKSPALAGLPESTKYAVTYPTYQAMGMDTKKLIASAGTYIEACANVKEEFLVHLEQTRKTEVFDKEALIEKERKEVERLTKEIHDRNNKIQALTLEATSAKSQLLIEESAFNQAYNAKQAEIEDHISKIKMYLDATTTVGHKG